MNTDWSIEEHPGYTGVFTRQQAEGAIPNGISIVKVWDEAGDFHKIGDTGTVLGSIYCPIYGVKFFYWVEWDDTPKYAVVVVDKKIGRKDETGTNEKRA